MSVAAVVVLGAVAGGVARLALGSGSPAAAKDHGGAPTAPPTSSTTPSTATTVPTSTTPSTATTVPTSTTTTAPRTTTTAPASTTTVATPAPTTTVPELPPSQILVEVLNGSGAAGAATQAADDLAERGFRVNGTGNAGSFAHVENVAEYSPGSEEAASTVAQWVTGGTELVPVRGLAPDEVYLVLGSVYHGLS